MTDCTGYASGQYAFSLKEFGEPRELPRCGGWILVRPIPGTEYKDAMGCYPLFACRDWTRLHEDLREVGSDLVSLVLVADSFADVDEACLRRCFDLVRPFKTHYITDLSIPLEGFVNKVHQYYARRALRRMNIEVCPDPIRYLDEWVALYDYLIKRHSIKGIAAFSRESFRDQLCLPGMVIVIGRKDGMVVGAELTLVAGDKSYGHLAAFSPEGYRMKAAYGIFWAVLGYLRTLGVGLYDGGGAAGVKESANDGLSAFKRGWSNSQRMVYLCGRVFNRRIYEALCKKYGVTDGDYFPAYRGPGLSEYGGKDPQVDEQNDG